MPLFLIFGTLVDEWGSRLESMYLEVTDALDIPEEKFRPVWSETFHDRQTGAFPTLEDTFRHLARVLKPPADHPGNHRPNRADPAGFSAKARC